MKGGAIFALKPNGVEMSLDTRLMKAGTLSEPKGYSEPAYSLPAMINWMRAMAIMVEAERKRGARAGCLYAHTHPKLMSENVQNTIFAQLLFALHDLSALRAIKESRNRVDVVRAGVISWYYGIYAAASAMMTALDHSFVDSHAATAKVWNRQIVEIGLMPPPFDVQISSLIRKIAERERVRLLKGKKVILAVTNPRTILEARACNVSHLSGTVKWLREAAENEVKKSTKFKELCVSDFKTKKAQEMRDEYLKKKKTIGFLHQAYRYRGKTNYRDAIFLSYGNFDDARVLGHLNDLTIVLEDFIFLSGAYCSRRFGKKVWNEYVSDLDKNCKFTLMPSSLWNFKP